jgi:hypothetical protein
MKILPKKNGTKTLKSECLISIGGTMFLAPSASEAAKVADMLSDFESVEKMDWHTEKWEKCGDFLYFSAPHAVRISKHEPDSIIETVGEAEAMKEVLERDEQPGQETKGGVS